MAETMKDEEALEDIEWHDSMLSQIVCVRETDAELQFRKVIVYRKIGPTTYAMEICAGVLELERARVTANSFERTTRDSQGVSDCIGSNPIEPYDLQGWLRGVGPGSIEFVMCDGSQIQATFEAARLRLVGPFSAERTWEGPLR